MDKKSVNKAIRNAIKLGDINEVKLFNKAIIQNLYIQ